MARPSSAFMCLRTDRQLGEAGKEAYGLGTCSCWLGRRGEQAGEPADCVHRHTPHHTHAPTKLLLTCLSARKGPYQVSMVLGSAT